MDSSIRSFEHKLAVNAPPAAVWALWMDTTSWSRWDLGLRDAVGPAGGLHLGSVGEIVSKTGQRSAFKVTEWEAMRAYAFVVTFPLGRLRIRRCFATGAGTIIVHKVDFGGPLAWLWAAILGRGFRRALPPTMARLAALAEAEPR